MTDIAHFIILSLYNKGPIIKKKKETHDIANHNRHLLKYFK